MALLNDTDPNLKNTIERDTQRVHYLDMWIEKSNGTLVTTLYRKKTDRNTLLQSVSFHPEPFKKRTSKKPVFQTAPYMPLHRGLSRKSSGDAHEVSKKRLFVTMWG